MYEVRPWMAQARKGGKFARNEATAERRGGAAGGACRATGSTSASTDNGELLD